MSRHYSEADLLETYYMQPVEATPVMSHMATCEECVERYRRLKRKLSDSATCATDRPATFWSRQRLSIMRKIAAVRVAEPRARLSFAWRLGAAAMFALVIGGTVMWTAHERNSSASHRASRPHVVATTERGDDPWESDELHDLQPIVQWESW